MSTPIHPSLAMFARFIATLRAGAAVVIDWSPMADPSERSSLIEETFKIGTWQGSGDTVTLHSNKVRGRSGITATRAEPCTWSIDDFLDQMRHWPESTVTALLPLPERGEDPAVDLVYTLADGGEVYTNGWVRMERAEPGTDRDIVVRPVSALDRENPNRITFFADDVICKGLD